MPRCFGTTLHGAHEAWLWLEDVAAPTAAGWPPARFGRAARLLGRWQGGHAAGCVPLPDAPWLSADWLRAWVLPVRTTPDPATDPASWRGAPLDLAPAWLPGAVAALWAERDALLAAVEALPRCLCHRDLWAANLLAAPDGGPDGAIAIIDWSQAGVGVLGEDPANLVFDSAWMYGVPSDELPTLLPLVLDEYCAGLREAGWTGDERAVRAGYAAIGALRFGLNANYVLLLATDPARGAHAVASHGGPLSTLVALPHFRCLRFCRRNIGSNDQPTSARWQRRVRFSGRFQPFYVELHHQASKVRESHIGGAAAGRGDACAGGAGRGGGAAGERTINRREGVS